MVSDVASMKTIISRLDESVEKLTDISKDVTTLLAVHENRIAYQERITNELKEQVEKRRDESSNKFDELHDTVIEVKDGVNRKIDEKRNDIISELEKTKKEFEFSHSELKKRMSTIERWMWLFAGGGGVIVFILENFPEIIMRLH